VDAVQAAAKLDPASFRGGDSITLAAHKIRGPKGIGALGWRSPGAAPRPLLFGGAQERGLRPGTGDPVAAAGFGAALARQGELLAGTRAVARLRDRIERELASHVVVNGSGDRLPHVTNLSVAGWRGDELAAALDLAGLRVSSGSACAAGTNEPSPVLTAMLGADRAASALRISLGEATSESEIERAIAVFHTVIARGSSSA
jgi:cysteine desulfurase